MGALFLSNGLEPCMLLFVNLLETTIDYSDKLYRDNNYKDRLLRYYHAQKWKFPSYCVIHFEGPPHKRTYIMGVEKSEASQKEHFKSRCVGFGLGNSKKEGEQAAAKMALITFGVLKEDQYTKADLYNPPWELISKYDGETPILNKNEETNVEVEVEVDVDVDDNKSVYSKISDKSIGTPVKYLS